MNLFEDMNVFVQIVDAGSFSDAARRLGVAKSVVSRRISALESRLEGNLFNRSTRRLSLTEIGQAYYERARRILDDVREAEDTARSIRGSLVGRLRLAAPMSFTHFHLSRAISAFLRDHPKLEIEINLNDRRTDLISEGFDLAVRIGVLQDSTMIARVLAPCHRMVCASPAYLEKFGEPRDLDELETRNHKCLIYSNRSPADQWRFKNGDTWHAAKVANHTLTSNNGKALLDAAIDGLGIAALPTFLTSDAISRGELKPILLDYQLSGSSIYAVWPPGRLATKTRALVEALSGKFGPSPYWDRAIADAIQSDRNSQPTTKVPEIAAR